MRASLIKKTLTILAVFVMLYAQAQQTSTDTTWKLKYQQTATPPPAWPKTLTVA